MAGGVDEAAVRVEVVLHLEAARGVGPQLAEPPSKMTDSGSRLAYRRRTDRADVASTLLAMDITGVMPLPPQKATIGRLASRTQKVPEGRVTSERSPSATWSTSQLETTPPGTRLTVTASSSSVSGALDME